MGTEAPFTHAGGVVYRMAGGGPEYLVVTALRREGHWILPKGHLEPGESVEDAAVREVREETGVDAAIEATLGTTVLLLDGETQRIGFFLMRALAERPAAEDRGLAWLREPEAVERLSFPESRSRVREAARLLQAPGEGA